MKCITLEDAYGFDYSIFSVLAFPQHWQEATTFRMPENGRPDSGFMCITDCENLMVCDGKKIKASVGQIVYLPSRTRYEAFFSKSPNSCGNSGNVTNYLMNFTLKDKDGECFNLCNEITVFTPPDFTRLLLMFREISEKSANAAYPTALLKCEAYRIITEISKQFRQGSDLYGNEAVFLKASEYIGENCLSREVLISELSEMCHVSTSTLRRIFISKVGMPPKDYISFVRLSRAKLLLENGDIGVAEASRLCGFDDPSYFSRFFKKHTGKNPVEYKKVL